MVWTLVDNGLLIFDWFILSMRLQVILDSLFAHPGSFGPTQINKSTSVDSDVELNSPNLIQFEPKLLVNKSKTETACKIRYNNLCIRFGT